MPTESRASTLAQRLLRYSAVASFVTATSLLLTPVALDANGSIRDMGNCNAFSDPTCIIDFDDPTGTTPEFSFSSSAMPPYGGGRLLVGVNNGGDAGIDIIQSNNPNSAAVLAYGAPVSYGADWVGVASAALDGIALVGQVGLFGNWLGTIGHSSDHSQAAYLGVKFMLDNATEHYGWIKIHKPDNETYLIQRIGYDTAAGSAIPAAVSLSEANAATGLRGVIAGAFTALAGVFT